MSAVLAEVINHDACPGCNGQRKVWSAAFKRKIRCTTCTKPRPSREAMRLLAERSRAAEREQRAVDAGEPARYTGLDWTISKLRQWGRMVMDGGLGYPPMSTTEKARIGRGGGQDSNIELPPDLEVIDNAVATAPVEFKTVLVEHYSKDGMPSEKAAHLGISRSMYYARKLSAERYIATVLGV